MLRVLLFQALALLCLHAPWAVGQPVTDKGACQTVNDKGACQGIYKIIIYIICYGSFLEIA